MAFIEFIQVLPKNKKVKLSVNPNNIVYFREPVESETQAGCTLFPVAGVEIYVADTYQDVKAKLSIS